MPRKHHRPRPDDWSQAMTWTIRMDTVPGDLNRRAAVLDRALRLSQLERRRRAAAQQSTATASDTNPSTSAAV